jgi:hypothetical protein
VLWDQTTDGARLMANALLYAAAAGDALTTPPFGSGQASTSPVFAGSSVLLTVTALPGANPASTGIAVAANLAAFGGSASQAFTPAGGNVFTHNLNIPAFQGAGSYSIPLTVTDAQARTGGGSIKLLVLPAPPAGFIVEAEPNDTPAQSTPAMLASGQGVVGHTTGASLTIPGSPSVDYFLISTAAAPPGIYRHRMAITSSGAAGHTGTLRGLTQTSGTINPGTDATFQTSLATTSPPRMNQWYGFGRSEQIRYRVAGSTTTSLEYIATLETVPVTPVDFPGDLPVGEITITRGTGTTATVDMLVYDAGFQPFMDFNNDGGNTLTRTFARGAYYLAVSNSNTADTRPSGLDSSSRSGNVLEFPGAVANSTTTLVATLTMLFTGGGGSTSQEVFVSKDNPFDVVWIKFRVGPPCDADFNGSGAVTVQDIFDFLGAYFTNNPAADINHSGSVTVQDIFDFLGTYFAGC